MSFTPSQAAQDPVIQVSANTIADKRGQTIEVDTTANTVEVKLPDDAVDGAEFNIRWRAGANACTIVGDTVANYRTQLEDGTLSSTVALTAPQTVPILQTLYSFRFSRATPYTGVGTGSGTFIRA
jgi:hypothetical protein